MEIDGRPDALFAHRKAGKKDIYFLYNPEKSAQDITARFRVAGKEVSLWDPQTGAVTGVGEDSVFIVFDGQNPLEDTVLNPQRDEVARQSILSPWTVRFDPEYGTAKSIKMQSSVGPKNKNARLV